MNIDLHEIVEKLNGAIEPAGEPHVDERRLVNLMRLTGLVDMLLYDIDEVATGSYSNMASIKVARECASEFLDKWGISK